jgi:hypothetical protein
MLSLSGYFKFYEAEFTELCSYREIELLGDQPATPGRSLMHQ